MYAVEMGSRVLNIILTHLTCVYVINTLNRINLLSRNVLLFLCEWNCLTNSSNSIIELSKRIYRHNERVKNIFIERSNLGCVVSLWESKEKEQINALLSSVTHLQSKKWQIWRDTRVTKDTDLCLRRLKQYSQDADAGHISTL